MRGSIPRLRCAPKVTRPTRMVEGGHLDTVGGQGGLRLEPVPLKGGYRCEEMVLGPSVLLGNTNGGHFTSSACLFSRLNYATKTQVYSNIHFDSDGFFFSDRSQTINTN